MHREKDDRLFRCLDCQYRRELVRVYLTNVEQIYRRFVAKRRSKLEKLIEDKARWSRYFMLTLESISPLTYVYNLNCLVMYAEILAPKSIA